MQEQLKEIEQLSQTLKIIKEYLERLQIPDKEKEAYRKKLELPLLYPVYGIEIARLRNLVKELHKYYKTYDFARFFKLFESLWINEHNSIEERYVAMSMLQQRRRDLDEPDICLDTWYWIWQDKHFKFVKDWSLTQHIANTVSYQIMEAWFELKESTNIIWNDLKVHAYNYENKWEQCLAILTPLKRLSKNPEWVLPTLEVLVFSLKSEDSDVRRAIELVLREAAKANPNIVFEFIKRFKDKSDALKNLSLTYIGRYFSEEQNKAL